MREKCWKDKQFHLQLLPMQDAMFRYDKMKEGHVAPFNSIIIYFDKINKKLKAPAILLCFFIIVWRIIEKFVSEGGVETNDC